MYDPDRIIQAIEQYTQRGYIDAGERISNELYAGTPEANEELNRRRHNKLRTNQFFIILCRCEHAAIFLGNEEIYREAGRLMLKVRGGGGIRIIADQGRVVPLAELVDLAGQAEVLALKAMGLLKQRVSETSAQPETTAYPETTKAEPLVQRFKTLFKWGAHGLWGRKTAEVVGV